MYRIGMFAGSNPDDSEPLNADLLPLYPLTAAAFNHLGMPTEASARFVSLAASLLAALLVILVAVRLGSWPAGAFAAVLIAFEPAMARLSYAVLTEPLYTAIVALGIWLMVRDPRAPPTMSSAIGLGAVFSLSFLDRFEGILFLAAIPFLQWCVTLAAHCTNLRTQLRPLLVWTAVFGAVFAVVAAPQVWYVSKEMNQFALNGRQAWSVIKNVKNGQSEEQRLNGLDYSPTVINLRFLQRSPKELAKLDATIPLKARVDRVSDNLDSLQRRTLPELLGLPVLMLIPCGLYFLLRSGQARAAFLLSAFVAAAFFAPLMYLVVPRYILAATPPLIALAAVGGVGAGQAIGMLGGASRWHRLSVPALLLLVTLVTVAFNARPLWRMATEPDRENPLADPYADPALYASFLPMLKAACASNPREVLLVRKRYIATFSGCSRLTMPYATLEQLRHYAAGNGASLMFVESAWDSGRPFYRDLVGADRTPDGFELLANNQSADGNRQLLYRLHLRPEGKASQ
jgi:4-amino-4-deoxy-L-arabinose transferase-like glycosyltransferase